MDVAGEHIGVTGMLVERSLRFVERDLRQIPPIDGRDQIGVILEMPFTIRRPGREAHEIVERMMMGDVVRGARLGVIDHLAFGSGLLHAVLQRIVPGARIPRPATPLADSVSAIVAAVCGGNVSFAGSA